MYTLDGNVAVVTGAGAGIGRAIAVLLAKFGAKVSVNDIAGNSAEAVSALIEDSFGTESLAVPADVSSESGARELITETVRRFGSVDICVNNAAAFVELKPFVEMTQQDWQDAMSSFHATMHCTKAVLEGMIGQGYGRIVNVTSLGGEVGGVEMSVYSAAKGAIHALSKSIAKEVAASGVTINCVAPGTVDTPRQRQRPEAVRKERAARIPVGRFATAEEVAHAALFLSLKESAYITGEIIYVDGGRP